MPVPLNERAWFDKALRKELKDSGDSAQFAAFLLGGGAIAQGAGSTAVGEQGVYVGGNVSGSINTGNVRGDSVHGDKVGGDTIRVGDIKGSQGIAIGRDSSANVTIGRPRPQGEVASFFMRITQITRALYIDKDDRDELVDVIGRLEREVKRNEDANLSRVERQLRNIYELSPVLFVEVVEGISKLRISSALQNESHRIRYEVLGSDGTNYQRLINIINQSRHSEETQQDVIRQLDTLQKQIQRREGADIHKIREILANISQQMPEMRLALQQWIEASPETTKSVHALARKLL